MFSFRVCKFSSSSFLIVSLEDWVLEVGFNNDITLRPPDRSLLGTGDVASLDGRDKDDGGSTVNVGVCLLGLICVNGDEEVVAEFVVALVVAIFVLDAELVLALLLCLLLVSGGVVIEICCEMLIIPFTAPELEISSLLVCLLKGAIASVLSFEELLNVCKGLPKA